MKKKYIIVDLDNTLYDWVSFFSISFNAFLDSLSKIIDVDQSKLIFEFKTLNQKHHCIERPFTVLELPSVLNKFIGKTKIELLEKLDEASYIFNYHRKKTLKLYDTVLDTLVELKKRGYTVIGCTDSPIENGYYRLMKLGISDIFLRLYVIQNDFTGHPNPDVQLKLNPPKELIKFIPKGKKKPDPRILRYICQTENIKEASSIFIGDSLIKDIYMANQANITSVWAEYGTKYNPKHWDFLVKVTHWTNEEIANDIKLKSQVHDIHPDYIISKFCEILAFLK